MKDIKYGANGKTMEVAKSPDLDKPLRMEPPPGSWAETARMMAQLFPDEGIDWDAWKDEMKDSEID